MRGLFLGASRRHTRRSVGGVGVKVAEKMPTNARRKTGDGIMEMNAGGDGGYRRTCENFRTERLEGGVCVPRKK